MTIATATIKGVELARVGTHQSALGPVTLTPADLAGAVTAHADPEVLRAPIKLGHFGGLALGDSRPACGWVENLRLSADQNTLIGDLADVPYKLAAIIPTAYRSRSVEMKRNVTTPSGKHHHAALTGLALLGASAPAVEGLADILDIYASQNPAPTPVANSFSVDFADGDITLGHNSNLPLQAPGASESVTKPAGQEPTTKESDSMIEKLRKKLGLPDTATDAEVEAAWDAAETAAADAGKGPDGTNPGGAAAAAGTPAAPAAQAPASTEQIAASAAADGSITLSAADFTALTGKVSTLENTINKGRHDQIILSAMKAGQVVPATEKIYRDLLAKDETLALSAIGALPKTANTIELGADHAGNADHGAEWTEAHYAASGL